MAELPPIALSVRQPWAWAIFHADPVKDIENRTAAAIANGRMVPRRICIHASKGMTRKEYESARRFMEDIGVVCPRPDALVRSAIIGVVTVKFIVPESASPWWMGPRGLVLRDPVAIEPLHAAGALGYFEWAARDGDIEAPLPWMTKWGREDGERTLF